MTSQLRPLQILCERRPSIFSHIPEFLSSRKSFADSLPAHNHQAPRSQTNDHLETKYGLRVNFENGQITTVRAVSPPRVSDPATESFPKTEPPTTTASSVESPTTDPPTLSSSSPTESFSSTNSSIPDASQTMTSVHNKTTTSSSSSPQPHYTYRLFPDWQTSYLWYGISYPPAVADGDWYVDDDAISSRYPTLAPYYFDWQEQHESAFERQGCHLGQSGEVFPDAHERAAWELEGFLMADWLAIREDVEVAEYKPGTAGGKTYRLGDDNVEGSEGVLREFLRDVDVGIE